LLLGHLPFQGQDSTQQHLIEIMKLLGTPSDKELRMMRATCSVDELPKLKAYPWERVFPAGTTPRAMDLASKLLNYDPTQRATATQALAHPFFQGVEYLMEGHSVPREVDAPKAWQQQLTSLFNEYIAVRNGAMQHLLPSLESTLQHVTATEPPAEGYERLIVTEVQRMLKEAERADQSAFSELHRKVLAAAMTDSSVASSSSSAGGGRESTEIACLLESLTALHQQGGDVDKARQQAQEVRDEAASMRAELDALHAQLADRGAAVAVAGGTADTGIQTEVADGRGGNPPLSGRRAARSLQEHATTIGAASPVVARQSMVDGDGGAAEPRSRSRNVQNMSSLAEDEMGQVTPLGMGAGDGAPRESGCDH